MDQSTDLKFKIGKMSHEDIKKWLMNKYCSVTGIWIDSIFIPPGVSCFRPVEVDVPGGRFFGYNWHIIAY